MDRDYVWPCLLHHPQPLNLLKPLNGASQVLAVKQGNQSGERFFCIAGARLNVFADDPSWMKLVEN